MLSFAGTKTEKADEVDALQVVVNPIARFSGTKIIVRFLTETE